MIKKHVASTKTKSSFQRQEGLIVSDARNRNVIKERTQWHKIREMGNILLVRIICSFYIKSSLDQFVGTYPCSTRESKNVEKFLKSSLMNPNS